MADFTIKKGDLEPAIEATLQDANGVAVNLSGTTVKFIMADPDVATPKVNATVTLIDAAAGKVKYVWAGTDTDTEGRFLGEFEVTWSGSRKQTFPSDGYLEIVITEDLD